MTGEKAVLGAEIPGKIYARQPIAGAVPSRPPPGRLKVLDALISMNLIRLSAWL